jgi:transposase
MGCHKADAPQQAAWRSSGKRPSCPQCIFWVLRSGAPWRDLPEAFGPWGRIIDALAVAHDAAVQMIDTSIIRVHQHGACITRNQRQSMGRSRGGLTSKIHALVDSSGLPVRLALMSGEAYDNRLAGKLLSSEVRINAACRPRLRRRLDQRACLEEGRMGQHKSNRRDSICFSPYLYRARNRVERFFNKIKQCRRVATRYDRLAANYLAFVQLASIRLMASPYKSSP